MSSIPDWFLKLDKQPCPTPPDTSKCLRVEKIATRSPAAGLGLKPGDILLKVNNKPALSKDISDVLLANKKTDYIFYLPQSAETLHVKTAALPLGIRTAPSSDGIVETYKKRGIYGSEGWFSLWERGDYKHLRIAAQACLKPSLVGKIFGKKGRFAPADLFVGICDIEEGELEKGYAAIDEFAPNMHDWTTDFHGLVHYYRGVQALANNDIETAKLLIGRAAASGLESDNVTRLAQKLELDIVDNDSLVGQNLALEYELKYLRGGKRQTTIAALLDNMQDTELLPLCLMPYYRGNGPYNAALLAYINIFPHIKDRIHPMVMLTDNSVRAKDRDHYFVNEDLCFKRKIPLHILHEKTSSFADALSLRAAPTFHALDKSGKVVWSGSLEDDYAYWDMVSRADGYS